MEFLGTHFFRPGAFAADCPRPDYIKYEAERIRDAVLSICTVQPYIALMAVVVHLRNMDHSWSFTKPLVLAYAILGCSLWCLTKTESRLRSYILDNTVIGISLQLTYFMCALISISISAAHTRDPVFQHRTFLLPSLALYGFCSLVWYVPGTIQKYIYPLCYFIVWLAFHNYVGYLETKTVVVGFVMTAMVAYFAYCRRQTDFELFQTLAALHEAEEEMRHVILAQQGMLKSIFDASCACNDRGEIHESTSKLEEMLGIVQGVRFSALASSQHEQARIFTFLENVRQNPTPLALTLQTSLSKRGLNGVVPQTFDPGDLSCVLDVKIFGIKFTGGKSSRIDFRDGVFLGIETIAPQVVPTVTADRQYAVSFDADSPNLDIVSSDSFSDVGTMASLSLRQVLPESCMDAFENWVCDEVQKAPDDKLSVSTSHVCNLPLQISVMTRAQTAWLEIHPQIEEHSEARIPVTLMVKGLRPDRLDDATVGFTNDLRSQTANRSVLEPILEINASSCGSSSSPTDLFPIAPWDSISQCEARGRTIADTLSLPGGFGVRHRARSDPGEFGVQ